MNAYKVQPGDQITLVYAAEASDISVRAFFDANGGSAVSTQRIAAGGTVAKPADPTRSGYTFKGWYTDSEYKNAADWTKAISADTTYYAKWEHTAAAAWADEKGDSRYDTMAAIVKAGGFKKGGTVIVATGENFPDALAASALAGALDAPIVLTESATLSTQASAAITALAPTKVIILGGIKAVSASVQASIKSISSNPEVTRIQGDSRALTAIQIYVVGKSTYKASFSSDTCIIATGKDAGQGADALAISPYAYASRTPVFLAEDDGTLSAETADAIKEGGFKNIIICGGTAVVGDSVKTQLAALKATYTRLAGEGRYETAQSVVLWETGHAVTDANSNVKFSAFDVAYGTALTFENVAVATGANFPDALASAPLVGSKGGVLLLADGDASDGGACVALLKTYGKESINGFFIGGTNALPNAIRTLCRANTK